MAASTHASTQPQIAGLLDGPMAYISQQSPSVLASAKLQQQRDWFDQAQSAFQQKRHAHYKQLKAKLTDYPLYPYLLYTELDHRLKKVTLSELDEFTHLYPESILAKTLRYRWLNAKAKARQYSDLLTLSEDFEVKNNTALHCQVLRGLFQAGQQQTALDAVEKIWLSGKSQPKECDYILQKWIDDGRLTDDLAWQRVDLAIKAGQPSLAKYLKRYLSPAQQPWVDHYLSIRQNPKRLQQKAYKNSLYQENSEQAQQIIDYGIKRLAQRDLDHAISLWKQIEKNTHFNTEERYSIQQYLALRKAIRLELFTDPWLVASIEQTDPTLLALDVELSEWRIREAMYRNQWSWVKRFIQQLPESEQANQRWQYWLARAEDKLNPKDDPNLSINHTIIGQDICPSPPYRQVESLSAWSHYHQAAKARNFYGFLAADRIGSPYQLVDQPKTIDTELIMELGTHSAMQRVAEFYLKNLNLWATREWRHLSQTLNNEQHLAAAYILGGLGWDRQRIQATIDGEHWNELQLRFPLTHHDVFEHYASANRLYTPWLMALARQESAFQVDARSPVGAMGLLQLMPKTAMSVAKKANIPYKNRWDLTDIDTNLALGSYHYKQLMSRYQDNRILSLAAYNAGAARVKQWLDRVPFDQGFDLWVELIPFAETRQYVQNVLAFSVIYQYRLNNPQQLLELSDLHYETHY